MLRRHTRAGFAADMWVFPGGVVDPADGALPADHWTGIEPQVLSARFRLPAARVLAHYVAAVRETFEEAGLLVAHHRDGTPPDLSDPALLQLRHDLADRRKAVSFTQWLDQQDLVLDLGALTYHSHWVTPTIEPRRYDTRFFVAQAPPDQEAAYDRRETTDEQWLTPAAALDAFDRGELQLIYPTIKTLAALREVTSTEELVAAAQAQPSIRRIQPHAVLDDNGDLVRVVHPDNPEYPWHLYGDTA